MTPSAENPPSSPPSAAHGARSHARQAGPVVVIGHCVLEHRFEVSRLVSGTGQHAAHGYRTVVGGPAGRAACAAHRLRHASASPRVRLVSAIGDDEAEAALLRALNHQGLSRQGLLTVPGARTAISAVLVAAHGEQQVHHFAGDALERAGPLDPATWRDAVAVQVDTRWPAVALSVLEDCRRCGVPTLLAADAAPADVLQSLAPLADWVVFTVDGLRAWAGERHAIWQTLARHAARQLERVQLVVALGAEGAWWHPPDGRQITLPAEPPQGVDVGASADVLRGALLLGLGEGRSAGFAMRWALAAASLAGGGRPLARSAVKVALETAV